MLRHDVRHHLRSMASWPKAAATKAIQDYIQSTTSLQSETTVQASDNYIFNSIYQYYLAKCEESGIELNVKVKLGQTPLTRWILRFCFPTFWKRALTPARRSSAKALSTCGWDPGGLSMVIIAKNSTDGQPTDPDHRRTSSA